MRDPIERIAPMVKDAIKGTIDFLLSQDIHSDDAANAIAVAILRSQECIDRVEMRPAYNWTCPECGRDSFVRAIAMPPTEEDRELNDIPEDETGNFVSYPTNVTCDHCGKTFKAMGFNCGEDDE